MDFQPKTGEELAIEGLAYQVAEHPAAPGMPYGQEGRQATVYRLTSKLGPKALKVFKPRYRRASDQSTLARTLATYATLPGLSVCQRTAISSQKHGELVARHPDLEGAVLMPWIVGPTWMLVVLQDRELTPEWSLYLASALARTLSGMEGRGAAHCDLSGPNILIPAFADEKQLTNSSPRPIIPSAQPPIEIVDVEQIYAPGLTRPQTIPAGSAGYAQRTSSTGVWSKDGDRFAGALLIAEILGWCDPQVRTKVWGESYFDPNEMQDPSSSRYSTMCIVLRTRWGEQVAQLLTRAWSSTSLSDCPELREWIAALPGSLAALPMGRATHQPQQNEVVAPVPLSAQRELDSGPSKGGGSVTVALQGLARSMEQQGHLGVALQYYKDALATATVGTHLHTELDRKIKSIEADGHDLQSASTAPSAGGPTLAPVAPTPPGQSPVPAPPGWIPVTVPQHNRDVPLTTSSGQGPLFPPSSPPPPPKAIPGAPFTSSYNAGIKAPAYSMPPGVASLATPAGGSSSQTGSVQTGTGNVGRVHKVPTRATVSGGNSKSKAGWIMFVLLLVAAAVAAVLWISGAFASVPLTSGQLATPTPVFQLVVPTHTAVGQPLYDGGATATARYEAVEAVARAETATAVVENQIAITQQETAQARSEASTAAAAQTSVAQATRAVVAQGHATAQALDRIASQVYGPAKGNLVHNAEDGIISDDSADVQLRNFIAEARFYNPYPFDDRGYGWDFSFFFRSTTFDDQYRFTVTASGYWHLTLWRGQGDTTEIATGETKVLDTSAHGSNVLKMHVIDNQADVFINREYIGTLDVSAKNVPGAVSVVTGDMGGEIDGHSTPYDGFIVWRLPDPAGEATATAEAQVAAATATAYAVPRVEVSTVSIEHNVYEGDAKGMRIHVTFDIYNLRRVSCAANAYFWYENGNTLLDPVGSGQLVVSIPFSPNYDPAHYQDFAIFVPYGQLGLTNPGHYELKTDVQFFRERKSGMEFIGNTGFQHFYYDSNQ